MKKLWEEVKEKCLTDANECLKTGNSEEAERLLTMALWIHNSIAPSELQLSDTSGIATSNLIAELEQRQAVQSMWVEPNCPFHIVNDGKKENLKLTEGPAKILVIWD